MDLAKTCRAYREQHNMTQTELAKRIGQGCDYKTISRFENGHRVILHQVIARYLKLPTGSPNGSPAIEPILNKLRADQTTLIRHKYKLERLIEALADANKALTDANKALSS